MSVLNISRYILLLVLLNKSNGDLEENDECVTLVGSLGVCTKFFNCPSAVRSIKVNGYHNFLRCGFSGLDELVCCDDGVGNRFAPDSTTTETATTRPNSILNTNKVSVQSRPRRKADIECQKLVNLLPPPLGMHIIGGQEVYVGEFPHIVHIAYKVPTVRNSLVFLCGGSLISTSFVLTAAHCFIRNRLNQAWFVRAGTVEVGQSAYDPTTDYIIQSIIKHPEYQHLYNDIALLRLERAVKIDEMVYPACLYTKPDIPNDGLLVVGWGVTEFHGNSSEYLLKTSLSLVPQTECQEAYKNASRQLSSGLTNKMFCAYQQGKDACSGDSGGPLQTLGETDGHYRVMGIVSFGVSCGTSIPGVYTKVYSFLDWIENIVWAGS